MRIVRFDVRPLSIPLREPFVIANARVDSTRAALVHVRLVDERPGHKKIASGLGEASALPGVTAVDQPDVLRHLHAAANALLSATFDGHSDLEALLDETLGHDPVARAGVEQALLDAWARLAEVPVHVLLGSTPVEGWSIPTDITIPIVAPEHAADLVLWWQAMGFSRFKVKVGKDRHADEAVLRAIHSVSPAAEIRLDGNEGLSGREAMSLLASARQLALNVTCFEQPCARDDEDGMAFVTELAGCPVIADESVRTDNDLRRVLKKRTANGINLKVQKMGGAVKALRLGRAASRSGLKIMMGAMVETRLSLALSLHAARALGHVDYADLDTALLLRGDPFDGGYALDGDVLTLVDGPGVTVSEAAQA